MNHQLQERFGAENARLAERVRTLEGRQHSAETFPDDWPDYYQDALKRWPWLPGASEQLDDEYRNRTRAENAVWVQVQTEESLRLAHAESLRLRKALADVLGDGHWRRVVGTIGSQSDKFAAAEKLLSDSPAPLADALTAVMKEAQKFREMVYSVLTTRTMTREEAFDALRDQAADLDNALLSLRRIWGEG